MRFLFCSIRVLTPCLVRAEQPTCRPTPAVLINQAPRDGFVPDATTAIKIAAAVWVPIYGKDVLDEKPFKATLKDGIWTVIGSLPPNAVGGVAEAHLCKSDASIVYIAHGK